MFIKFKRKIKEKQNLGQNNTNKSGIKLKLHYIADLNTRVRVCIGINIKVFLITKKNLNVRHNHPK